MSIRDASRNILSLSAHALGGRDRVKNSKISSDLDTKTFMNKMGILKLVVGRLEAYINHVTVLADSIKDRILDGLIA